MKKAAGMAVLFALLTLSACGQSKDGTKGHEIAVPKQNMTGSDRDAHGCIGSAGYRWCGRIEKCVRPWELAKEKGFEKSEKAFKNFCEKEESK